MFFFYICLTSRNSSSLATWSLNRYALRCILFYFPPNLIIKQSHLSTICSPFSQLMIEFTRNLIFFSPKLIFFLLAQKENFNLHIRFYSPFFNIISFPPPKTSDLSLKTKYSKGYIFFTPGNFQCYNVSAGKIFFSLFRKSFNIFAVFFNPKSNAMGQKIPDVRFLLLCIIYRKINKTRHSFLKLWLIRIRLIDPD